MPNRINCWLGLITFCATVSLGTNAVLAQNSVGEFHQILREKAAFDEPDFAALEQGQIVARLLPVNDKREVAVSGLVSLQVPTEVFLQSFRENMTRKNTSAILEIGSFSATPTLADLQTLTFEDRDIDDLKDCVVGNCKLKLSAKMIERLQKEVNWEATDYRIQATQLLKKMLLDYVADYQARGDAALIEYNDKPQEIRLAEEHRALMAASSYLDNFLPEFPHQLKDFAKSKISIVENAIVWSKIKFGMKPVIAFNHIVVYRREQEDGPQILVSSKQIYANHYFDSSLAFTAFVTIPGATPASYLYYENRSRADGLGGAFSGIKRDIVERNAIKGLKTILETSTASLHLSALNQGQSALPANEERRPWRFSRVNLFLLLLVLSAFIALFTLGNYRWRAASAGKRPSEV